MLYGLKYIYTCLFIIYIEMNVLLENTPFVKFVGNYSQDPGGIFSIYMDDFTSHFFMVVCVQTVNKIT